MTTGGIVPARLSLGSNYLKLWASSAAANLADGIFLVALPLMAASLTSSPALVAGVAIAGRLPWLVFVLVAGALADRFDRRLTMRNVQVLRVAVLGSLALLALAEQLSLLILYVAAFVLGVRETLFDSWAGPTLRHPHDQAGPSAWSSGRSWHPARSEPSAAPPCSPACCSWRWRWSCPRSRTILRRSWRRWSSPAS